MLFEGWSFTEPADGPEAAFPAEVAEGIKDEPENLVAAGLGDCAVPEEVGLDGVGPRTGVRESLVGGFQGTELGGAGVDSCEPGGFRLDRKACLGELPQPFRDVGNQEGKRVAQGLMKVAHYPDSCAMQDPEEAALFKAFGGLAHDRPAHSELFSERPFGGQPEIPVFGCVPDDGAKAFAHFLDARGGSPGGVHGSAGPCGRPGKLRSTATGEVKHRGWAAVESTSLIGSIVLRQQALVLGRSLSWLK